MHRIRQRLVSGLVVLVPLGITLFVLSFLLRATVGAVASVLGLFLRQVPPLALYPLAGAVLLAALYFAGAVASNIVGRKLIRLAERILEQVPLVKTVYGVSKQLIALFQEGPAGQGQRVVLADFPAPGLKAFGFLTGSITTPSGMECYTIFVPTTPNPTTGFLQVVPKESVDILDISIEEAFRTIMSAGYLAPPALRAENPRTQPPSAA